MKSVVIYKTKHGSTESCALKVAKETGSDIFSLHNLKNINLLEYDHIIIGTYIHMYMIPSEVKKFFKKNAKLLKTKKISVFLVGMADADEMIKLFKSKMPSDIIEHISIIRHFGGLLQLEKLNFIEKAMMKKIVEENKVETKINEKEVNKFIKEIMINNEN